MKIVKYVICVSLLFLTMVKCIVPGCDELKFKKDHEIILENLKSLGNYDNAEISWKSSFINNNRTCTLVIKLIKRDKIKEKTNELKRIGRKAIDIVNMSISNEQDYENFEVIFIKQSKKGLVNKNDAQSFIYWNAQFE